MSNIIVEQDSVKKHRRATPLPKLQLAVLLYLQLAEPITSTVILPFIVQLVEETGITGGDVSKVGYYAGLVESLFFITESLMILQWGRLSDRIGRRPVLLTGLFGLGLSMLCFGLSQTFWSVVASRALAGALNGNTGVIKCMLNEITDETNLDKGLSFMPIIWSIGNTIGPLIGGSLQHPYERFGGAFQRSKFWETNPYFLPCAIAAACSTSAFVLAFSLLNETLPSVINRRSQSSCRGSRRNPVNVNVISPPPTTPTEHTPLLPSHETKNPQHIPLLGLLTPRVLAVMINYAFLALTDIAYIVLLPVFLSTPIAKGGLGMEPSIIGVCLAGYGIANGVVSVLFFVPINRRFGTRAILWSCGATFVICFALFPVMNTLARAQNQLSLAVWIVLIAQLALATIQSMAYSAMFIFLATAVPTRSALGATTGLAQTIASIMRAIGPAGATSLFAVSVEHHLFGGIFVYVVLCTISMGGSVAAALLPAVAWPREDR